MTGALGAPSPSRTAEPKVSMMNRFLSRREKEGSGAHRRGKSRDTSLEKGKDKKTRPKSGDGILSLFKPDKVDPHKKGDTEEASKLQTIKARLLANGYSTVEDEQITYALGSQHADGDADKAFELVILFQESVEGIIKPYRSEVNMLGAENRGNVTCYLDSLLFAMFARLSSFEPLLCTNFEDEPRRRLSTLIRLWVNMLREGKLIKADITRILQESLASCGWEDAARVEQQDVSEAFCYITEKLELPLLTLKVDIYHNGGADRDDHRFVEERLLNVAVPDEVQAGRPIRLEDCLENYFNNRVEVKRHLERTNTLSSIKSGYSYSDEKGGSSQHIEVSVRDLPWTSIDTPTSTETPNTPISPGGHRGRAVSIIRHLREEDGGDGTVHESDSSSINSPRRGSKTQRREILMPAWQFFNLIRPSPIYPYYLRMPYIEHILIDKIAWYTRSSLNGSNAAFTTHLSQTSPVLGICLKRYGMTEDGRSFRKNTLIDIPLEMRIPHFADDTLVPEAGQVLNFKLSLQSIICHRGNSVQSGHYISLIRGTSPAPDGDSGSVRELSNDSQPPDYSEERWIKFDDLAEPRVSYVDIEKALEAEMPYLLFYQVQSTAVPSTDERSAQSEPPSYTASAAQSTSQLIPDVQTQRLQGYFDGMKDETMPTIRLSTEVDRSPSPPRHSFTVSEGRRGSLAFTDTSFGSGASSIQVISTPVTPNEETTAQRMSRAAARFTKSGSSKSRPTSQSGENRIGGAFSRLNLMRSKDNLNRTDSQPKESKEPLPKKEEIAEPRGSITIEEPERPSEHQLRSPEHIVERSKSKKEKKRDKSKGPSERSSSDHHHHHLHKDKGKGKSKDDNDRECGIM